jgi:glycosyltransferase involved in cell wall biosynthesis
MGQKPHNPGLWERLRRKLARLAHKRRLVSSIRHLHGPARLDTRPEDVTLVVVVKNGIFYLEEFLRHYRDLGIRHFVFFDNGSDDGTIERIKQEAGTVILQSLLPTAEFEPDFRRYAAEKYCRNRWCLYADIDEFFAFEGQDRIGLTGLVRYLTGNGYTTLVAQMLDLFSEKSLQETANVAFAQVLDSYRFYDLEKTEHIGYHDFENPLIAGFAYYLRQNTVPDPRIKFLFGGIRNKMFGEICCLTKHPLVFLGDQVAPGVHPHFSGHVKCADFTALLKHYKFCDNPIQRDRDSVKAGIIPHGADKLRLSVLAQNENLGLYSPAAHRFTGFGQLYDQQFLVRSDRFTAYVDSYDKRA